MIFESNVNRRSDLQHKNKHSLHFIIALPLHSLKYTTGVCGRRGGVEDNISEGEYMRKSGQRRPFFFSRAFTDNIGQRNLGIHISVSLQGVVDAARKRQKVLTSGDAA